jgi:non-ribosomal peptide synthetase-like protein
VLSRALGAQIGARVFDDGCAMPERTLVSVGDDCTLSSGSIIQCHSQEDGSFKSDRSRLAAGCTLGTGALVHYGATLGDGVVVAPDSFLMKGTQAVSGTFWSGNPAHEVEPEAARPALTAGPPRLGTSTTPAAIASAP